MSRGSSDQLFIFICREALIRSVFAIGIDSTLTEEVTSSTSLTAYHPGGIERIRGGPAHPF